MSKLSINQLKQIRDRKQEEISVLQSKIAGLVNDYQSHEIFHYIFENSNDAIVIFDIEGKFIDINTQFCQILNYSKDEILSLKITDIIADEFQTFNKITIARHVEKENALFETQFKTKDNLLISVEANSKTINYRGQKAILSVIRDITKRREEREALKESEEMYKQLISAFPDAIFFTDIQGIITFTNQKAVELYGHQSINEMIGRDMEEWIVAEEHGESFSGSYNIFKEKHTGSNQYLLRRNDGTTFFGEINASFTYQPDGAPKGMIAITRDITERKLIEKNMLTTLLDTEEEMRKSLAEDLHDGLGPLLSSIKIHIGMLKSENFDEAKRKVMIRYTSQLIDDAISDASKIANNLMPNILRDFGLPASIKSFCQKVNPTGTIDFSVTSENFDDRIDQNFEMTLYRIIKELINNSLKHSNAKKITIKFARQDNILKILYTDNGKGFDLEKVINRKKRGIGLQSIYSKINSMNGKCDISSSPGRGINVHITLHI